MKIALLQTGKTTDKNIADAANLYSCRIQKYSGFEIITLPDIKNTKKLPVIEQKIKEGRQMLQWILSDDFVVLLDEKGEEMSTIAFSGWLEKIFLVRRKRIVFVIGGPWGFSEEMYYRSDFKLSLSKMTFPHQLVRLLFLEQLYRTFTILKGEAYHHE
jgi:23S rRNA (pseudouridine1915-N3)-methyltransferase